MRTYKINAKEEGLLLLSTCVTVISSFIGLSYITYFVFFFGVGLYGDKIKKSLKSIIKLSPDSRSLSSLLATITFVAIIVSLVINRSFPSNSLGLVLLSLNKTNVSSKDKDTLYFSLSITGCYILSLIFLAVMNEISAAFKCFYFLLSVASLLYKTKIIPTEEILSVLKVLTR